MTISGPYTPHRSGFAAYVQTNLLQARESVLISHLSSSGTFYAAIVNQKGKSVYALIMPVEFSTENGQEHLTYQQITERVGPSQDDCPARVLDSLDTFAPLPILSGKAQARALAVAAQLDDRKHTPAHRLLLRKELYRLDPDFTARDWRERCQAQVNCEYERQAVQARELYGTRTPEI